MTDRAEYKREWQRRNRHKGAEYKRTHRDVVKYAAAAHGANKRARLYGAPGVIRSGDVRAVLANAACAYCGASPLPRDLCIDHRIPLHTRGPNERGNLQAVCRSCNSRKHRRDRPGRWSARHDLDACIDCGTTDRPHLAHGRCSRCDARNRRHA